MAKWRARVGLEVHAESASVSKLFSREANLHIPSEQSGRVMRVAIKQIHLEQDSGRIQYNPRDPDGNTTVVNFRRSGVPLMMPLALTHT